MNKHDSVKYLRKRGILYIMLLPLMLYYVVFQYGPMYGTLIAFQDFNPFLGMAQSQWVGFKHFAEFFESIYFFRLLRNTILLSVYSVVFAFPLPIIFALLLHETRSQSFRSTVQSMSYLPHFISTVVIVGLVVTFLSPSSGIVNAAIRALGGKTVHFMLSPGWFRPIYIISGIWQQMGWSSIIYYASLAAIDPQLYDAASIDGAGRIGKIVHVSIPGIAPTIVVLLLLNLGRLMSVGFEKVFLLYNPSIYETADVISTYVYRAGLIDQQYSFAAAVGLFNSVVSLVLIVGFNRIARALNGNSLW